MEKKLLLNYFLKKAMLKEQELLGVDDREAILAVIFSATSMFHRCASGVTTEQIYFAKPKYALELFLLLCLDAEQHGDHLLKAFDFKPTMQFCNGNRLPDFEEQELTNYLESEVYPRAWTIEYDLYASLLKGDSDNIKEKLSHANRQYIRSVVTVPLEQPESCAETTMIDRAWNRIKDETWFINMLSISTKHDLYGRSAPHQRYVKHYDYLLKRI